MNTENIVSCVGWIGVAFCTFGFLLLNTKVIKYDSWIYQSINVIGGLGLVISALYLHDIPNTASNSIWIIIALYGLLKPFVSKKRRQQPLKL